MWTDPPKSQMTWPERNSSTRVHLWCAAGLCTRTHAVLHIHQRYPLGICAGIITAVCGWHRPDMCKTDSAGVSDALSLAVTSLSSWLDARGLVLNAKKSNVLVFTSSSGQQPGVGVRCRNDVLQHTTSAKYLGVLIDERMTWQPQVDRCISRTARKIGSLWRARHCLTLASPSKYFLSVIMPDLIYGSSAYGSGLTHN